MKTRIFLLVVTIVLAGILACKKSGTPNPNENTTFPEFISLTADKDSIKVGGTEPAILTCMAQGGNIQYVWEVDLGDIFPLTEDGSVVRFTGAECCLGQKYIKCTISNDKGSIMDTVIVTIYIP
ncbi:MAG: hypothetical protein V1733_07735 [bacterium]